MDKIDMQIISILQKNCKAKVNSISKEVFLSAPSVKHRIIDMEGRLIKRYTLDINYDYLNLDVKVMIYIDAISEDKYNNLIQILKNNKNVLDCNFIINTYKVFFKAFFRNQFSLNNFLFLLTEYTNMDIYEINDTIVESKYIDVLDY